LDLQVIDEHQDATPEPAHQGRLQRKPTAAGYRVTTFNDVIKRHGVTMACLAAICLVTPGALSLIVNNSTRLTLQPLPYVIGVLGLLLFFSVWSTRRPYSVKRQSQWILYLLLISITEELTFRLILPSLLSAQLDGLAPYVLSNLLFAAIHYVTLRWRLRNCIVTFFGAMGLSHLMMQGDLALVVLVHWCATFLNTPAPPAETAAL
jgi:membrane protease YdiL (CAAX protease family)